MIHVLIIDDLKSAREMIRDILASDADIHVCAMAHDLKSALEMLRKHHPQMIVLDSHLKGNTGYDVAHAIVNVRPTPIMMMVTGDKLTLAASAAFTCGVLDVFKKTDLYRWRTRPEVARGFIRKIKHISKATPPAIQKHCENVNARSSLKRHESGHEDTAHKTNEMVPGKLVAIVSSTGGPNALFQVLRALPPDFSAPILMVQHMSPGFIQGLAAWLGHEAHIRVRVGEDREELQPGVALLAPDGMHLTIGPNNRIKLIDNPPVGGHRPSGNALLESVAGNYGPHSLGVILTGMGRDGAEGMAALKKAGGQTIAQDRTSSVIFGMPHAAIQLGVVNQTLPLVQIAPAIVTFIEEKTF